jgi:hypothetical protein
VKKSRRASKNQALSQSEFVEVKRRALLICHALDCENDEKLEELAIESIEILNSEQLLYLANLIENHGFFEVAEAIASSDLFFFGEAEGS